MVDGSRPECCNRAAETGNVCLSAHARLVSSINARFDIENTSDAQKSEMKVRGHTAPAVVVDDRHSKELSVYLRFEIFRDAYTPAPFVNRTPPQRVLPSQHVEIRQSHMTAPPPSKNAPSVQPAFVNFRGGYHGSKFHARHARCLGNPVFTDERDEPKIGFELNCEMGELEHVASPVSGKIITSCDQAPLSKVLATRAQPAEVAP